MHSYVPGNKGVGVFPAPGIRARQGRSRDAPGLPSRRTGYHEAMIGRIAGAGALALWAGVSGAAELKL